MGQIPPGATVTIYRARHDFEYRNGETIKKGEPWRPMGERNDAYIQKHLCYQETVAIDEDVDDEGIEVTAAKNKGSRRKTT